MTASLQALKSQSLTASKSIDKSLLFAQNRLLDSTLPHQLKVVSYVRLCCSAIRTYHSFESNRMPTLNRKTPYLTMLNTLSECQLEWWNNCSISDSGYLVSDDYKLNALLQSLNSFVAQHLEVQQAA